MPSQKAIEREAARARSAKPSAWVTGYERDRYVDEKHINVTTTIGDLAGSHGAVYRALKEAGITPARTSAGSLRLTVDENLPLSQAKALVVTALKAAGIKVHDELAPLSRSHATKKTEHPSGVEWSDLASTGIRVQTHSGDMPLEDASAVEIRHDMNRRLAGYRAQAHVPARRKKCALSVYELAQAKPWVMDQVPNDVWGLVLADIGRSGPQKRAHAIKQRVLEKGQRVAVLDYRGHEIGRGHVYSSDNYPAPNEYTTWVKMTRHGETTTEEWPTDRVRPISKHG